MEQEDISSAEHASKRLPNAFILFCKKHRSIVKEKYPNLENRNITKILGEWWTSLGPEDKNAFNSLAAELKEHHAMREQPRLQQRKAAAAAAAAATLSSCTGTSVALTPSAAVSTLVVGSSATSLSRHSSGSSSPEPSPKFAAGPGGTSSEAAPKKTFKQRYLNDEKAKLSGTERDENNACEALLQLAGVSAHSSRSDSGTSSPKESSCGGGGAQCKAQGRGDQFQTLRDAVWARVAKTLLMQDKEKGNSCDVTGDTPLNLSNQCTIRGQTIIEHIIENILEEPLADGPVESKITLNNNTDEDDATEPTDQIKEKIYQSLKEDIMNRAANNVQDIFKGRNALWNMLPNPKGKTGSQVAINGNHRNGLTSSSSAANSAPPKVPAVSVTLLPNSTPAAAAASVPVAAVPKPVEKPLNLSTTPPQTPDHHAPGGVEITMTSTADDEEEQRKTTRSCKGRRYQEFKDSVGKKGVRRPHRSGDSLSEDCEEATTNSTGLAAPSDVCVIKAQQPVAIATAVKVTNTKFDVDKQLNAIPPLSLELFQQKVLDSRIVAGKAAAASSCLAAHVDGSQAAAASLTVTTAASTTTAATPTKRPPPVQQDAIKRKVRKLDSANVC